VIRVVLSMMLMTAASATSFALAAETTALAKDDTAATSESKAANQAPAKDTNKSASDASAIKLPESHAQQAIKKIPRELVNAPREKRFSLAEQRDQAERLQRGIDVIEVYGVRDPEDVTAKKLAPMLAFRQRLEKDKPLTPWQIARMPFCFIGLCPSYGSEGIPVEDTATTRGERNAQKSSLELANQFRGTLQ
jgi:hypothetical protein